MTEDLTTAYAVIIVNYGDPSLIADDVGRDVDDDPDALVVVVDNFHSDAARTACETLCRERGWLFVASANDGFGAGVNRGVIAARARGVDTFITLNPDAIASASVLRELAAHVRTDPGSLVSPFMEAGDGSPHFRGIRVSLRTGRMRSGWSSADDPEWANWLSGACLAFSSEAVDRTGGFSEDYFLYWEDVDLSRRAVAQGLRLELRPDLLIVHDEGGTHAAGNARAKSPTYYYFNIRNRLLFGRRNLRGRRWARWVLATPRESALIWMRGGRRQAFTEPRGLLAALRGVTAGLSYVVRPSARRTVARPPRPRGFVHATSPSAAPPRITVAIPSYRRPERLATLLDALPDRIAETPDALVDILVVDNDPEGSAWPVVDGRVGVRYVNETTPGISAARNRALDECRESDLIAFLDDDEIPRPAWLSALLAVWRQHRAAAVSGRLVSVFQEDTDPWIIAAGTFYRQQRPTGTRLPVAATYNLLLDVRQIQELDLRFEEALGLSGGEDTLFTRQLVERGGEIVWCNESVVDDVVASDRLTREWAAQRAFSAANALVHVDLSLTRGPLRRLEKRAGFALGGGARVAAGLLRHGWGRLSRRLEHDARGMRTVHRGRGMIAGARGHLFEEYSRTERTSDAARSESA